MTELTETRDPGTTTGSRTMAARVGDWIRAIPIAIWLLVGLALFLRVLVVRYGLPQEFDPDEEIFVRAALRMIRLGTLDPDWYGQPASTLIDGLAALYTAHGLLGVLSGAAGQISAVFGDYRDDATHVILVGRIFTSLVGVATLLVVYAIARELRIRVFWSTLAVLVLAVSAVIVRYSTTIRADTLQIFFMLLLVLVTARSLTRPRALTFVLAGACLGLAVTSKYPGVIGLVPILAAAATLVSERTITARTAFVWLLMAGIASLAVAFVAGPYLFLNVPGMLAALTVEARTEHLGATSEGFGWAIWSYLTVALPDALGWVGTLLGIGGAIVMLGERRARLAALTFWAYLLFIAALSLWWERWVLPLIPLAALAAAYLLDRVDGRARARFAGLVDGRRLTAARLVVAALVMLPMLVPTLELVRGRALNDDTRVVAADWVHAHLPPGATMLVESYAPGLPSDEYDLLIARDGELIPWQEYRNQRRPGGFYGSIGDHWCFGNGILPAAIAERGVDYVLVSDSFFERYDAERSRYRCEADVYDELFATYPVIETFDRQDAALGPTVFILRAGEAAAGSPNSGVRQS